MARLEYRGKRKRHTIVHLLRNSSTNICFVYKRANCKKMAKNLQSGCTIRCFVLRNGHEKKILFNPK